MSKVKPKWLWETEIMSAIGFSSKSATDILRKLDTNSYTTLKRHLTKLIEDGKIVVENHRGHRKFRVAMLR